MRLDERLESTCEEKSPVNPEIQGFPFLFVQSGEAVSLAGQAPRPPPPHLREAPWPVAASTFPAQAEGGVPWTPDSGSRRRHGAL